VTRVGLVAAALLLSACSQPDCEEPADCADLLFHGESYDEYRPIDAAPPGQLEELGNATYPKCNCDPDDLGGLGATDVWRLDEIDGSDAVIGVRAGTSTYVVFVRVGVDPESLPVP
jgi:hypothetical protein